MNRYGQQLMKAWEALAPAQYARLKDPNRHFSILGEEAMDMVEEAMSQVSTSARPGEPAWATVGRINAIRQQVEEQVLHDLIPAPQEPQTDSEDESTRTDPMSEDLEEYLDRIEHPERQVAQFTRTIDELRRHQSL